MENKENNSLPPSPSPYTHLHMSVSCASLTRTSSVGGGEGMEWGERGGDIGDKTKGGRESRTKDGDV